MTSNRKRIFMFFGAVGLVLVFTQEALAIIGRPATPVSVAGAARRSVRRGCCY